MSTAAVNNLLKDQENLDSGFVNRKALGQKSAASKPRGLIARENGVPLETPRKLVFGGAPMTTPMSNVRKATKSSFTPFVQPPVEIVDEDEEDIDQCSTCLNAKQCNMDWGLNEPLRDDLSDFLDISEEQTSDEELDDSLPLNIPITHNYKSDHAVPNKMEDFLCSINNLESQWISMSSDSEEDVEINDDDSVYESIVLSLADQP